MVPNPHPLCFGNVRLCGAASGVDTVRGSTRPLGDPCAHPRLYVGLCRRVNLAQCSLTFAPSSWEVKALPDKRVSLFA